MLRIRREDVAEFVRIQTEHASMVIRPNSHEFGYVRLLIVILVTFATRTTLAEDRVNFNRDVRPILAAKCFACHGPDKHARKSGLRLDTFKGATAKRDGSVAIIPKQPGKSEAWKRITTSDTDLRMPPKETGKTLTAKQKDILRRWIAQGAEYTRHWAFVKPKLPPVPEVKNDKWSRNAIDRFILNQSRPAAPRRTAADKLTLIRRVYLDLIGLPPMPEEVDAVLKAAKASSFDKAYEQLVDRLLKSPRYGERWATPWLDLARYADTNGYEKDRPRDIWAYRDWVIDALNRDLPFDQFTMQQLAGDLMSAKKSAKPQAALRRRIATGFHRNTMLNEEGGIDPLEFRFHAVVDRVATTGTTWLGLSLGCAQCHSHKYDPISHHDYYRFFAFLNNADEPEMDLPDAKLDARHMANLAKAKRLLRELPSNWPVPKGSRQSRKQLIDAAFQRWLKQERARTVRWKSLRPAKATSNLPILTIQKDDSIFASGDTAKVDIYKIEFTPKSAGITAMLLEALPDPRLPEHGPGSTYYEGTRGDFFLGEIEIRADGKRIKIADASHSYAKNRFGRNPVSAKLATDGDPQTGWSVHGRQGERHTAVFVLDKPLPKAKKLTVTMKFGRHFASSLGRFRISATTDKTKPVARDFPSKVGTLLLKTDEQLSDKQRQRLFEEFLLNAKPLAKHAAEIRKLRKRPDYPTTLVLRERPKRHPRPTHLHTRGEFLRPAEQVIAATPTVLHPFPNNIPNNRLGLAKWIVSPENPLTARVVVNREWAALFGRGLVASVDDFGVQADAPSHPELLDWLAVKFMTPSNKGGLGWSMKRLHKLIVMSATYRQSSQLKARGSRPAGSSRAQPAGFDRDNKLLRRAPRLRLPAEVVRDSALRVAGLLSTKMGGPGVRPPQPKGITEIAFGSPKWVPSQGEDRYRRSVYTFIKRTAPFAMHRTFDAPSRESCTAKRDRSNTPLQALTLLNDAMFTEIAQAMGRLLTKRKGSDADVVRYTFRRTLTREPSNEEKQLLVAFVRAQRKRLKSGELNAKTIAGGPTDAVNVATWTTLARALFGLDEFVTRN